MSDTRFKIKPNEAAIVFRDSGVEFHYPKKPNIELQETFEFLTFALIKSEWVAEWYEYLNAAEALADLAGETKNVPHLTVIEGGKSSNDGQDNDSKNTE